MTMTVKNAIALLELFTINTPELGLSGIKRLSGIDKATTHRLLTVLRETGMLEQNPVTKLYRLGASVLRLAQVREASFPFSVVVQPILETLAGVTGETAHCSLYTNNVLAVISSVESNKANRVSMRGSETLPFHATAAGIAYLAYAPSDVLNKVMKRPMPSFSKYTCTDPDHLKKMTDVVRKNGYAVVDKAFEDDVFGVAAPIFGAEKISIGAIAVATPCHRMNASLEKLLIASVVTAAADLSQKLGN